MTDLLWQGLTISLIGMGLTFAALGLLILVMYLLERLTRSQLGSSSSVRAEPALKPTVSTLTRDTEEEEIAAAVAVALAHLRSLDICRSGLGSTLEVGPGPWWRMGQTHQLFLPELKTAYDGAASHDLDR